MKIEYLKDHPELAETAAKWIYDEFIKDIKKDVSYETVLNRYFIYNKTKLPIHLVAITDEQQCVGTISIDENDLKCRKIYTPWLSSLYVDKPFRSRKVAQKLINRVIEITKELGYKELYLRTEHTSDYYKKRGWLFVESCEDEYGLKPDIFKLNL